MRISDWSSDVCSSDLCRLDLDEPLIVEVDGETAKADHQNGRKPEHGRDLAELCLRYDDRDDDGRHKRRSARYNADEFIGEEEYKQRPEIEQQSHIAMLCAGRLFDFSHKLSLLLRSDEHTSELQSLMRTSYAVFCFTKKNDYQNTT